MMTNLLVKPFCRCDCVPFYVSIDVHHLTMKCAFLLVIFTYFIRSKPCSLNIHYVFDNACDCCWTRPITDRASPQGFRFCLDDKNQPIHPAPSPRIALDQALRDFNFRIPAQSRPNGYCWMQYLRALGRALRSDGACKAHCFDSGESQQFISARAAMSLPGLPCFRWGSKRRQIFYTRSLIKNRNRLFLARARLSLHSAGASCSSQEPTCLNALLMAECHFACGGAA